MTNVNDIVARVKRLKRLGNVAAAVVNDDDFEIGIGLRKNARNGPPQHIGAVERGNDD